MPSRASRTLSLSAAAVATSLAAAALALPAPTSAAPAGTPAAQALAQLRAHPAVARASEGQAFVVRDTAVDADGASHVRLDRTYRDLPVRGGDLVVHLERDATWDGVSQTLATPVDLATQPSVTPAQAQAVAARADATTRTIRGLDVRDARLVVDALDGAARLAWEVTSTGTHSDGTPSRLLTWVDARSGEVIRREERIQTAEGQGRTLYSGTVPLQVSPSGTGYVLKDPTRGGTYTVTVNNTQDGLLCGLGLGCAREAQLTSPDTSYGDGTTANAESAAADAQYGTNVTWDYYQQVHGRAGIFGDGTGSYNRVHYGKNYANAFWDGTRMTYGDGDGTSFGPLVSLDVAGHEMSHGVTEHTAKLTYSGEPGGLNEATSDILGSMVEFYAANAADPGDYFIGEEFDKAQHDGFRRMDDPDADGKSANCWTSTVGNLDVHYSSGVGNHFFYLLAEGSGPKVIGDLRHDSPTCDGSTVGGIGRDAAQRIWFRALSTYMTSGTKYAGARTATLRAAEDLFGAGSAERAAVAAAWSAVGVN